MGDTSPFRRFSIPETPLTEPSTPGWDQTNPSWDQSFDGTTTPMSSVPSCIDELSTAKYVTGEFAIATTHEITLSDLSSGIQNICFIGGGFVGGPTAALIAYHNPHIRVNVVDLNIDRVAAWNSRHLPIHEKGLDKIVRIARDGTRGSTVALSSSGSLIELPSRSPNLFFSTKVEEAVAGADIIFICVNTPTKINGIGAGASADLGILESATITIARNAKPNAIIVEKSTVPCGTAKMVASVLHQYRTNANFEVLSNPEFLAEGCAVENLMQPDRVLIGSSNSPAGRQAAALLKSVYEAWVPVERILTANTFSSELTKLIANAMLAQRISGINTVSALCEELGADVEEVSKALGADSRLGPKFLQAGVGFGGSCFEKDILNLSYLARTLHLEDVADYWMSVLQINQYQRERFARTVVQKLHGSLRGKKITIFGFAFKDGTNDTRNSVAVHIIAQLAAELPREISIYDPGCDANEIQDEIRRVVTDPTQRDRIRVYPGWTGALRGALAVCILTPWEHFRTPSGMLEQQPSDALALHINNLSLSCIDSAMDGKMTEMNIIDLEKLVINQDRSSSDLKDPLKRLRPEPICEDDCKHCTLNHQRENIDEKVHWEVAARIMEEGSWVFDGRNIINSFYLKRLGFKVHCIGKGVTSC